MPDTVRITCINKREHHNPHERITNVRGLRLNKGSGSSTSASAASAFG